MSFMQPSPPTQGNKCRAFIDNAIIKPFKIFGLTLYRWWLPRICMVLCIIFVLAIALGFKITVNQSVFDLNENVSARGVMWYIVGIYTSIFIAFYVNEWIFETAPERYRPFSEYMRADGSVENMSDRHDSIQFTNIPTTTSQQNTYEINDDSK